MDIANEIWTLLDKKLSEGLTDDEQQRLEDLNDEIERRELED